MGTIGKHMEIKRSESSVIEKRSISYFMFMYLEEKLYRKTKKREMVLCKRKLNLTRKLLWISVNQIEEHDTQDLNNISREDDYAGSLRARIRKLSQKKTKAAAKSRKPDVLCKL